MSQNLPKLGTESETADNLGVSWRTLQGWRQRGEGPPYIKLGAGVRAPVRYDMAEVAAWLEKQKRQFTGQGGEA